MVSFLSVSIVSSRNLLHFFFSSAACFARCFLLRFASLFECRFFRFFTTDRRAVPFCTCTAQELTPARVVEFLDKFVIGQQEGKRAIAVALRNRWRRQNVVRHDAICKNTPRPFFVKKQNQHLFFVANRADVGIFTQRNHSKKYSHGWSDWRWQNCAFLLEFFFFKRKLSSCFDRNWRGGWQNLSMHRLSKWKPRNTRK